MLRTRIIPCLQSRNESLVKTRRFGKFQYIGDPANTCRIFNELEVDELMFLDITASREGRAPNFEIIEEIASECFMPVSYGGGISSVETAEKVLKLGIEKVVMNSSILERTELIREVSEAVGRQSVVVAVDVRRGFMGGMFCWGKSGTVKSSYTPEEWATTAAENGAGEILLTSIDREGTWKGFDIDLIQRVSSSVSVPVIAHGGAASVEDIGAAVKKGGAAAVALGSMVVFQKKGMGVLVNVPDEAKLNQVLA